MSDADTFATRSGFTATPESVTPEMLARFWHFEQRRMSPRVARADEPEWEQLPDERRQLLEQVATLTLLRIFPERMAIRVEPASEPDVVACSVLGHSLRPHECRSGG